MGATPVRICAVALSACAGGLVAASPTLGFGLFVVVWAVAIIVRRPWWLVYLALIAGVTTLPSGVPQLLPVGGVSVYIFEPLIYGAALYCALTSELSRPIKLRASVFLVIIGIYLVVALASGYVRKAVIGDFRGPLITVCGFVIAASVVKSPSLLSVCTKLLRVILWWSAALVLASQATGLALQGRISNPNLENASSELGTGAARFQTATTHTALAVTCGCIALLLVGRTSLRRCVSMLAPALLLVILSFSRNSVIAVVVAVVAAVLLQRRAHGAVVLFRKLVVAVVLVVLVLASGQTFAGLPGLSTVQQEADAYSVRVLSGFSADAINNDSSAQYRIEENTALDAYVRANPIFGKGFGFQYKMPYGSTGSFTSFEGTYFAHNFYLWIWVKAGLLGLIAFFYMLVTPIFRRFSSELGLAAASALAGFLLACIVVPFPEGVPNGGALTIGALAGVVMGLGSRRQRAPMTAVSTPASRGHELVPT